MMGIDGKLRVIIIFLVVIVLGLSCAALFTVGRYRDNQRNQEEALENIG